MFGSHPALDRAWLKGDPVTVKMHPSPSPINPRTSTKLDSRVLHARSGNRGVLALNKNQVRLQESLLKRVEFCINDFPDFVTPNKQLQSIAGISTDDHKALQALARKLKDAAIKIQPSPHHILLDSGNGWNIRLTRDEQQTRSLVNHTGLVEKSGGSEYGADELTEVLEGLKYFLAFAAGRYCHPSVVIGYDSRKRPIWGEIGHFETTQNKQVNWFDNSGARFGASLEALFSVFWPKWMKHKDEMAAVISCYTHSNTMRKAGLPQDAVAKSYTGLEILASLELGKTIFYGPSEDIQKVLEDYTVPHLVLNESETPLMARLSQNLDELKKRGAHLLNQVRNYIAHPLDRNTSAEVKQKHLRYLDSNPVHYHYLHDLSQFYLEYSFLKFCGYQGVSYRKLLESLQQV